VRGGEREQNLPARLPYFSAEMSKLTPYAFLLAGALGLALYPRVLGAAAPPVLQSDGLVGFVHGICIGMEVLAVLLLTQRASLKTVRN
jgi:hypothetical protein